MNETMPAGKWYQLIVYKSMKKHESIAFRLSFSDITVVVVILIFCFVCRRLFFNYGATKTNTTFFDD